MLQNIKDFYGRKLRALDGEIGRVRDFYFDDKTWGIRYLVADTGAWLTGRLVLLSPHAFGRFDQEGEALPVNLTRQQIEGGPDIGSHRPISRPFEEAYHRHYGWPIDPPPSVEEVTAEKAPTQFGDGDLRSTRAIAGHRVQMTGYRIQTIDGLIGEGSGFLLNAKSWAIRYLVVETGPWHAGREVLIATAKIERISFEESKIFVNLTKADIRRTAGADRPRARVESGLEVFGG